MSKPTIVLAPGAWHKPDAYGPLIKPLESAGYKVKGVDFPSVIRPGQEPTADFQPDVDNARKAVEEAADQGEDVILLGHSYGGFVICDAAKGNSKEDRAAQGKKGGVVRLVFLAAFAPDVGVCLFDGIGGQWLPWWKAEANAVATIDTENVFYNDLPRDSPLIAEAQKTLHLQSEGVFSSKCSYAAWKHIDSVYIVCTKDNAIPPPAQEGMASQPGKWVEVIKLDSDHIPIFAKPEETVAACRKAFGEK